MLSSQEGVSYSAPQITSCKRTSDKKIYIDISMIFVYMNGMIVFFNYNVISIRNHFDFEFIFFV